MYDATLHFILLSGNSYVERGSIMKLVHFDFFEVNVLTCLERKENCLSHTGELQTDMLGIHVNDRPSRLIEQIRILVHIWEPGEL